ncbi:MAG: hypothetical protein RL211_1262 [Pseudomonadota bacterium]|jgi:rhamnosyl/mannosyltransferase
MRILHFYKTSFPDSTGGIEQAIDQLARSTSRLGLEVDVLCLARNPAQPVKLNGYTVYRAPLDFQIASTGFSVSAISQFARLARRADLIHYHFPWPFMDLVHFVTRLNKPSVLTYHSDIIRQKHLLKLYKPLKAHFLNAVSSIVATSPNYLATSDVLARFKDKVRVIPIGLDQATYPQRSEERLACWHRRFGDRYFVFVGVLRYYKGLHVLLQAAQDTGYPVAIAGAGPLEKELKQHGTKLGMSNVHFLGFLSEEDKMSLIQASLGVVFPSHLRSEAFGISLLEGAMCGKPLISSEIGTGTTFINIHQETGLVVEPGNPVALREAMRTLWNCPEKARIMGAKAYQRYRDLFTADQMAKSYMSLYQELLTS